MNFIALGLLLFAGFAGSSKTHLKSLEQKNENCKCGWTNEVTQRIFGGEDATPNEFPFISGITRSKMRLIFCGSSIITPYHAITAAHCFYNKTAFGPFSLIVGEHDVRTETSVTQDIPIQKYILHEDYNPSNYLNDIALIVLESEITFSRLVGPVCLPNKKPLTLEKKTVTTIGWGRTPTNPHGSPVLQKVNLNIVPRDLCTKIMNQFYSASGPNQLCTYGKNKSACSGDSGGPVVLLNDETNTYTLVGVVSYGTKQCAGPIPRVATEVSKYLDWIHNQLAENMPAVRTCSAED